jgi:endonuclease/exonuclease/phosphatase family metal-dependent hydrolase
VLVRSWNLFHGNAAPPEREAFLDEMVRLATADDPDVLCVQEVPAWALRRFTAGDVASRPMLGATIGRLITSLNHGVLRSAFAGQGNATQVSPGLRVLSRHVLTLNPPRFRAAQARILGLGVSERLVWAKERRIVQALRLRSADGRCLVVANMHCTSSDDERLPDLELLRAAQFAGSLAAPGEVLVLVGDFNVHAETSRTLADLVGPEWGFSAPGPGIDHVLVRGTGSTPVRVWPAERRRVHDRLLSDHAPVEVEIE